jgi:hypothetical protein
VAHAASAADEELGGLVELGGVAAARVEHRAEELLGPEPGGHGAEAAPGAHPVVVPVDGVDLAVVAQHPERLGPFPRGQGVGAEPLVEDGEGRGEALVGEVEVEVGERVGGDQALVDDGPERARRDVGALGGGVDPTAQPEGAALELLVGGGEVGVALLGGRQLGEGHRGGVRRTEDHLHDGRPGAQGQIAEGGVVGRRGAPLHLLEALLGQEAGHRRGRIGSADEEDGHAGSCAEDGGRDRGEQPGAVGGPGVGGDRPPVLDVRQSVQGGGDDRAGGASLGVGDEADAAGIELAHGGPPVRRGSVEP